MNKRLWGSCPGPGAAALSLWHADVVAERGRAPPLADIYDGDVLRPADT